MIKTLTEFKKIIETTSDILTLSNLIQFDLNVIKYKYPEIHKSLIEFRKQNKRCKVCKQHFCKSQECIRIKEIRRKEQVKKLKQTKLERYGDENYNNSAMNKENRIKKYGYYFNNSDKAKQTNLRRYGTENVSQSLEIKLKKQQTNLKNYGEIYTKTKEFKNKIKKSFENRSKDEQAEINEKRKQTCLKLYGVEYNVQAQEIKDKIKQTNLERYGVEYTAQKHLKNMEDLSKRGFQQFINENGFFDIDQCMEHFGFDYNCALSYKKKLGVLSSIKQNRLKTQTKIFNSIDRNEKTFNDRKIINDLEIDIYFPPIKLGIEYNGLLYHSEGINKYSKFDNKPSDYHLNKTLESESKGIQLFHIFEGESLDLWLSMIHNKLGINKKIYARDCIIKEIKSSEIVDFLNENHIQGYANAKICLGLFYNKSNKTISNRDLLAVMTFSKPRFNKGYEYELIRFCSLKHHNILGAASKLFKYFIKKYNPKSIISYANRRFSNGDIYKTLGFTLKSVSQPNYFYFNTKDFILESRNKYQKHKLEKYHLSGNLNYFNKNESEAINMFKTDTEEFTIVGI